MDCGSWARGWPLHHRRAARLDLQTFADLSPVFSIGQRTLRILWLWIAELLVPFVGGLVAE